MYSVHSGTQTDDILSVREEVFWLYAYLLTYLLIYVLFAPAVCFCHHGVATDEALGQPLAACC